MASHRSAPSVTGLDCLSPRASWGHGQSFGCRSAFGPGAEIRTDRIAHRTGALAGLRSGRHARERRLPPCGSRIEGGLRRTALGDHPRSCRTAQTWPLWAGAHSSLDARTNRPKGSRSATGGHDDVGAGRTRGRVHKHLPLAIDHVAATNPQAQPRRRVHVAATTPQARPRHSDKPADPTPRA